MAIVAIGIDAWKLAIFKRHLDEGGYSYTVHPGITDDTLFLKVKCDFIATLQRVVKKAQKECKLS